MAVHVIGQPLPPTSTGHALTIGLGDTVIVTEAGVLAARNLGWCGIDGISVGNGGLGAVGTNLVINGRVSSADFYGIATNGSITIGQTGAVSGRFAINLVNDYRHGTPNSLVNLGAVTGRDYGIFTGVSLPGEPFSPVTITNTGTISGEVGIGVGGDLTLINSGLIKGTGGIAISAVPDSLSRKITNTGVIDGSINLSGGHDLYDGRGGHVNGMIRLGAGNDTAFGGAGSEAFWLGEGANIVDGGDGIDTLYFRSPAYVELSITDEQQTSDTSRDTIRNIENLTGSEGEDFFVGNRENNVLSGAGGNDWLDGALGSDTLNGGAGADVLIDDSGSNFFNGEAGDDYIQARSAGSNILDGGMGDDGLYSYGSGNDILIGGAGWDTLYGGSGTDVAAFSGRFSDYVIDFTPDVDGFITIRDMRASGDGVDLLKDLEYLQFADRTIALREPSNHAPASVSLSGTSVGGSAPAGTVVGMLSGVDPDGDPLGYFLVANPGNHFRIHGNQLLVDRAFAGETRVEIVVRASDPSGASIDRLFSIDVTTGEVSSGVSARILKGGRAGDALTGGQGHDTLNGGLGGDTLTGGAGRDTFAFTTKLGPGNVDRIMDFRHADDTIRLSKAVFGHLKKGWLTKDAFWIGAKAHDGSDRIIFNPKSGGLYYDADGSGVKHNPIKFAQLKANTLVRADDLLVV